MKNLVSSVFLGLRSWFSQLQVKQFMAVVLAGVLLLGTNVVDAAQNKGMADRAQQQAQDIDSVRPKTTREWKAEARATEDAPGDRLKNIAEETGQALKEFGSMYPDVAEDSGQALQK